MKNSYQIKTLKNKRYHCEFELTLEIIGGKWKLIIIYFLAERETVRFGELHRLMRGISERMLVKQLRELEQDNIVHREVYKTVPPKVEYSLTKTGKTLIPIMNLLCEWGSEYNKLYQIINNDNVSS